MSIDTLASNHKPPHEDHPRLVEVKIDGREVKIPAQRYAVPDLKSKLGVPLDYELDVVKHKELHPLKDDETFKVVGREEFISHVRCGGSS